MITHPRGGNIACRLPRLPGQFCTLINKYLAGGDNRRDDDNLLCSVIQCFETALHSMKNPPELSPRKKAQTIAMLYRASKASGSIDQQMVEDAIALARQD
jgi:hypothetical protein